MFVRLACKFLILELEKLFLQFRILGFSKFDWTPGLHSFFLQSALLVLSLGKKMIDDFVTFWVFSFSELEIDL